MPELAEVQILADQLNRSLQGADLEGFEVFYPGWVTEGDLCWLAGLQIESIDRWGKRLRFNFSDQRQLISGLGLAGNWLLQHPDRHLVAKLSTSLGPVYYSDPRHFGHAQVFQSAQQAQDALGDRIGLDAALTITDQQLKAALRSGKIKLKAALLDQGRLSGIGNYLADEICFESALLPVRPLESLTDLEWEHLNLARSKIITRALEGEGASFSDYRHADGSKGEMQQRMAVYGRSGLPCPRCGFKIQKSTVAGRGTHHCPSCQS